MIKPKLKIETARFQRTLDKYLAFQQKDMAKALNKKGGAIAIHAIGLTHKAALKDINKGVKWTAKSKEGLRRWTFKTHPRSLKTDAERKQYFDAIQKLRKRSIAYLKAGWIPAARKLTGKTPKKGVAKGEAGKVPGYARKAKNVLLPVVELGNLAGQSSKKRSRKQKYSQQQAAKKYGKPALRRAFEIERKDMVKYLEMKAAKAAKAAGM